MNRAIYAILILLTLPSITGLVFGQAFPILLGFGTALPVPIGQTPTIAVTVTDISNNTVQLSFVGLRFEWNGPSSFFIGSNSEKGAILAPGQAVTYAIPVAVPGNVTPATHRLIAYATYRVLRQGNWSAVQSGWWVEDLPFAFPQATPPPPANSSTEQALPPFLSSSSMETIGVVILIVAIGLFLERGRIRRLLAKRRPKAQETQPIPTPASLEAEKPATEKATEARTEGAGKEEEL